MVSWFLTRGIECAPTSNHKLLLMDSQEKIKFLRTYISSQTKFMPNIQTHFLTAPQGKTIVCLDLFGDVPIAELNQQAIIEHTIAVIENLQLMHQSALKMCLHMFHLRAEFDKCQDTTWTAYCKNNFSEYGLSESGIRHAVRTGGNLVRLSRENGGDNVVVLEELSRSALFAFGDAPQEVQSKLLGTIAEIIEDRNGKAPTSGEVQALAARLAEAEGLLQEKDGFIKAKDAALHRLNTALNAREEEAAQTRQEIDSLHRKIANAAQAVVQELPAGVKDVKTLIKKLEDELHHKQQIMGQVEADTARMRDEAAAAKKSLDQRVYAQNAMDALESDIKNMQMKYSQVLVEKIRAADRAHVTALGHLANGLRALADTLSPSLL